jgi:hypothetical protein
LGAELDRGCKLIKWLEEKLNLIGTGLAKLVQTSPSVLGFRPEILQERAAWLQTRLALDGQSLSKLTQRHPSVLGKSVEQNLKPKLSWLQERLNVDDKSLRKLAQKMPSVKFSIRE